MFNAAFRPSPVWQQAATVCREWMWRQRRGGATGQAAAGNRNRLDLRFRVLNACDFVRRPQRAMDGRTRGNRDCKNDRYDTTIRLRQTRLDQAVVADLHGVARIPVPSTYRHMAAAAISDDLSAWEMFVPCHELPRTRSGVIVQVRARRRKRPANWHVSNLAPAAPYLASIPAPPSLTGRTGGQGLLGLDTPDLAPASPGEPWRGGGVRPGLWMRPLPRLRSLSAHSS